MTAVEFGEGVDGRAVPKGLMRDAHRISEWAGGYTPVVTGPEPGLWQVTISSDRVELVARYSTATGKAANNWWLDARVSTDGGEPVGVYEARDVMRAFADPDHTCDPTVTPTPTGVELAGAPGVVRKHYQVLTSALAGAASGAEGTAPVARVGRIGLRWVICLDTDRIALCLRYARQGKSGQGAWTPSHVQVHIDGEDRTAEVGGDLGRAMTLVSAAMPTTPGHATRGAATTATSVVVRTTTVIRT